MTKTTLAIQGMSCNHCAMRVAKALKELPGVKDVQVEWQKAEAAVSYDEAQVDIVRLSAAVADAGYQVVS